jgi:hypothetical protein
LITSTDMTGFADRDTPEVQPLQVIAVGALAPLLRADEQRLEPPR